MLTISAPTICPASLNKKLRKIHVKEVIPINPPTKSTTINPILAAKIMTPSKRSENKVLAAGLVGFFIR